MGRLLPLVAKSETIRSSASCKLHPVERSGLLTSLKLLFENRHEFSNRPPSMLGWVSESNRRRGKSLVFFEDYAEKWGIHKPCYRRNNSVIFIFRSHLEIETFTNGGGKTSRNPLIIFTFGDCREETRQGKKRLYVYNLQMPFPQSLFLLRFGPSFAQAALARSVCLATQVPIGGKSILLCGLSGSSLIHECSSVFSSNLICAGLPTKAFPWIV